MNKLLVLFTLCTTTFFSQAEVQGEPYISTEFSIPDQYKSLITGYPNQWIRLTGYEYSAIHWKQFIIVYTNLADDVYANNHLEFMRIFDEDLDDDEVEFQEYPVGTILLKESFINTNSKPGNPLLLSGMIKHEKNYDPDFGDWEYFQSTNDGTIIVSGNSKNPGVNAMCINCHVNIPEKDFVYSSNYSFTAH